MNRIEGTEGDGKSRLQSCVKLRNNVSSQQHARHVLAAGTQGPSAPPPAPVSLVGTPVPAQPPSPDGPSDSCPPTPTPCSPSTPSAEAPPPPAPPRAGLSPAVLPAPGMRPGYPPPRPRLRCPCPVSLGERQPPVPSHPDASVRAWRVVGSQEGPSTEVAGKPGRPSPASRREQVTPRASGRLGGVSSQIRGGDKDCSVNFPERPGLSHAAI